MKKNYCYLLLLAIVVWGSTVVTAQNKTDSLFASVNKRLSGHPSEIVYLQTSKGIYETGEDLWFKAYGLDAQSFALSDQSKTLYLQMINGKDSVVWQEKYPIENGIAEGHVYVDEKLSEGDYSLEGYTRHSCYNDTIGMLPICKVRIVKNITQSSKQTDKSKGNGLRFNLFPEGGNLVAGILSRIAFKTTDSKGYPVDVEGTLFQDDSPIITFNSSHDGMGMLSFTPFLGKNYRIELKDGQSYPLPTIYPKGISLRLLRQNKDRLEFIISQTKGLPEQEVYLLGQIRGMIGCVAKGRLKDNLRIKIPTSELTCQGIVEFTLFSAYMQPVAERLVYVHPEKRLNISMEAEKDSYVLREKATLKIKVSDEDGKPVRANLGISVFDKAYPNPANPTNILTHCYLSSQIRGIIHNPAYYFDEENKDRMQAMELLLLTQGWRRYVWGISNPAYQGKIFLTDEIRGVQQLESKRKSKEMKGSEQIIQVSGAEGSSAFAWTDSTGCFKIDTDMMKTLRGGYVYLKPMLSKEFKPELNITDYFPMIDSLRKSKPSCYPIMDLSQTIKSQVLDLPVVSNDSTILLNEVVISRKARRPFRDKFMGRLDSLAQMDLNKTWVCKCHPMYLNDYYEGYTHHPNGDYKSEKIQPIIGKSYRVIKYNQEMIVEDIKENVTYEGVIYSEEELLRMNNLWRSKGYYAAREFYQPDEIDMQLSTPDARNTLFWQPSVITDEKGEATVSFFCSDINTAFVGIAEGVDGTGLLGSSKCEFRVIRK